MISFVQVINMNMLKKDRMKMLSSQNMNNKITNFVFMKFEKLESISIDGNFNQQWQSKLNTTR
jgi:hypothetical protein